MVEDLRGDHQFVRAGPVHEFLDLALHGVTRAHRRTGQHRIQQRVLGGARALAIALDRRRQASGPSTAQVHEGLLPGGRTERGLFIGLGREHIEA